MSSDPPDIYIGRRISKYFPPNEDADCEGGLYGGTVSRVVSRKPLLFRIEYDDGDSEDLTAEEVEEVLATTEPSEEEKKMDDSPPPPPPPPRSSKSSASRRRSVAARRKKEESSEDDDETSDEDEAPPPVRSSSKGGRPSRRAASRVVQYNEDDEDDSEDFSEDEEESKPAASKRSRSKAKAPVRKKARVAKANDDSDFDDVAMDEESSSSDEEMSFDEDESSEEEAKPAALKKASAQPKKTVAAKASGKKSMAESFQPISTPLFKNLSLEEIASERGYYDPCGVEATDDIIKSLEAEKVDKLLGLFKRAIANDKDGIFPLKLGTACSGTDAPAIAMTLIKEVLEERGYSGFDVKHLFSCENDAFKQAYLARNFDSILYPDIGKLTGDSSGDEEYVPRDVYGQARPLPDCNLFVAGTSCKNFSMLRSKYRIDIEDKGCSGETFLAAVEVLFKKMPQFAIFENVLNAPWQKMVEYITGRVKLSSCGDDKFIKEAKSNEKKKELSFVVEDEKFVVDFVPPCYGIRCGAKVAGYLTPESDGQVTEIKAPKKSENRTHSLTDVLKTYGINKATDTLVFETPCAYCTHTMKVDSKLYGLPQTRQRVYMFVWRPEKGNVNDDLGDYWEAIFQFLQSPARNSMEAFILEDDHEIIRTFREGIAGPLGRATKGRVFQQKYFWNSTSANFPHNRNARTFSGINETARTLTQWHARGRKQIPPHYWKAYIDLQPQREMDALEVFHASAARDAECHDSSFSSFCWNVSQNVSKEKHRTAVPGIAGCITPGGDLFLPNIGRPLLGCEKLLLQGIPFFRLALGNETEVQLGDLAGNAMSMPVVSAAMLAAMLCTQLRREATNQKESPESILANARIVPDVDMRGSSVVTQDVNCALEDAQQKFEELAALAEEAVKTSVWCTCETSGRNSLTSDFLECCVCRVRCCRDCTGSTSGYQMSSHETVALCRSTGGDAANADNNNFHAPFYNKLRTNVPNTFAFSNELFEFISKVEEDKYRFEPLHGAVFKLDRIKRDRMKWKVFYYARANVPNGLGDKVAEFVITLGEIGRKTNRGLSGIKYGLLGEIRSFLPARVEPTIRGIIEPCAYVKVIKSDSEWKVRTSTSTANLKVVGSGETQSFRAEVGVNDLAAKQLKQTTASTTNKKTFEAAKKRKEERRWVYPDNWKVWPSVIDISSPSSGPEIAELCGSYKRAKCRQTTPQSGLWVREASRENEALYLIIKPNVQRTGPDVVVISSSMSSEDSSSIKAEFPRDWQPCDALISEKHEVVVNISHWSPFLSEDTPCSFQHSLLRVKTSASTQNAELVKVSGLSDDDVKMLCRSVTQSRELELTGSQVAQQRQRVFNALIVPPVLREAASSKMFDAWKVWTPIQAPADGAKFGCCEKTIPRRPEEKWFWDKERQEWDRLGGEGESRLYYKALQESPKAFRFCLDHGTKTLTVYVHPEVAAHHAAHGLVDRRGDGIEREVTVQYRLTQSLFQADPVLDSFKVHNCDEEEPTIVELKGPHELYSRQQKALTKLAKIEDGNTSFEELEMSEIELPGATGWNVVARAVRERKLLGGVICDAIGAGKTIVSIALILRGLTNARRSRSLPRSSSASLVVVPPGLIDQWKNEIDKFTDGLKVILIYDFKALKKVTLKEFLEADVVIIPIDILEDKGYLSNLIALSEGKKPKEKPKGEERKPDDIPSLPTYVGQRENIEARGCLIPATSADPYGGDKNFRSQRRRNESARFTFVYLSSIEKLRNKEFKDGTTGIPIEYFEWERLIIDEVHESLCTRQSEMEGEEAKYFKERNRRAGRELLGITERDNKRRPLTFRKAIFGLSGTPLLDSTNRVIELASLVGNTYIIGLSSHWRRLERESARDIFLENFLASKQTREIRKNCYEKCQVYLDTAAMRNKSGDEMKDIALEEHRHVFHLSEEEGKLYKASQHGIAPDSRSYDITLEDFDPASGHDVSVFLKQNAKMDSRKAALVRIVHDILAENPRKKIIVFADGRVGAGIAARDALNAEGAPGCTWIDTEIDSVEDQNRKIGYYQRADSTREDRERPRVLVLHFEHAAGLNLQSECNHLILYTPLYTGKGGTDSDPVADCSTELQAIGRVFRPGQLEATVHVYRLEARGPVPGDEELLDGYLIGRNTDEETKEKAINSGD